MRKIFFLPGSLLIASLFSVSCGDMATNNVANRPANNAGNTANAKAPAADSAAIETEIKKLVNETAAALAKNDADALDKLYSDNYMLVNLDGSVQNKAERLGSFRSGDTKFASFVYDEMNVRSNPEGTGAIVIARATATGTNKGVAIAANRQIRVTQVWAKMPGGWKQVSGHATTMEGGGSTSPAANATNTASNTTVNKPANTAANK